MKKSQILAALALAFALGVVAPVAGTYAEEGIMPLVDTGATAEKSATNDNLKSAVNYVTSNAAYDAYATLAEAKTAAGKATTIADANNGLVEALKAFAGSTTTGGSDLAALNANIGNVKNAVGTNYDKYAALYKAMSLTDAEVANIGSGAAIKDVEEKVRALGYTFNVATDDNGTYTETFAAVKTAAEKVIDDDDKTESYDDYEAAVAAVNAAVVTRDAFNGLQSALKNANLGLTATQVKAVNNAKTIDDLSKVVAVDDAKATAWAAVANKITEIEDAIKNANGTTNTARYELLDNTAAANKGLLQLMQTATDNEDLTYAQLISAAPIVPGEDQKPETPGDNKPGEDQKDPSAPGTGVVSSAEGNAATTVSIVAGLATALTALGAGVVAYRSARRSNK